MNKINVLRLIGDHFRTLRDYRTEKTLRSDIFVFFAVPLGIAAACAYFRIVFDSDALIAVLTAFSIFAGLLFSLLLLVFSMAEKVDSQSMLSGPRKQLIEELFANISFSILVSIAVVTISIVAATAQRRAEANPPPVAMSQSSAPQVRIDSMVADQPTAHHSMVASDSQGTLRLFLARVRAWGIGQRLITFSLVLLMANFILTLLMALKRMHALLTVALRQPQKDQSFRKTA